MERRKYHKWHKLFWAAVIVQLAMFTTALNVTTDLPPEDGLESGAYAWSSWGRWSSCSKSCGGGVAVQERECLPRTKTAPDGTLPPPVILVRVTRQTHGDCLGVARRYHECNTAPCPKGEVDIRAEQCAVYDRRPFRGRFYTWVPYIDGNSPCTLNCRPLGQQFYASLALVTDGTPCTRPGFRAICVQGACKIVGRDTVIAAANARELRCGRRLVSGLFSRPRLPLGYSFVTTVPRGACRLNVSEIVASENYIALKISNSSYIMNGEFAVSAPGTYEAAGARFVYSRAGGLDNVFALGPILHPIDIMVLYTQPNPSIRYEYFTESPTNDADDSSTRTSIPDILPSVPTKHTRRHHSFEPYPRPTVPRFPDLVSLSREVNSVSGEDDLEENIVGSRKFAWRITTYTQCTRSCGGGIQLGKYRCVEISSGSDKEVSPVHCPGSAPVGRRRRCNNAPCTPRWRAAAWSACPQCGPAMRTRIVGCVQDHFRGITKVNDQKCPTPKPATSEPCNIPNCVGSEHVGLRSRPQENTDTFRDGPIYTVAVNSTEFDVGPEYSFGSTAGWLYTEWSECVGWCVGGGVQTRGVRCADPSGCTPRTPPETSRNCTPNLSCEPHDGRWFTGEWSPCSSPCGGRQIRGVLCIGGSGRHLRDTACKDPKPEHERDCGGDCSSSWFFSDWEQCTGNCTSGVGAQRRSVLCMSDSGSGGDGACALTKPASSRACEPDCAASEALPSEISIESQKAPVYTTTQPTTMNAFSTLTTVKSTSKGKGCEDKLNNCALAVQARLCHYKYYVQNCCDSCNGR